MKKLEILEKYNLELDLKYSSVGTKTNYLNALNRFLKDNSRVSHMSKGAVKYYMSAFRSQYSDSYFNIMGSALIILYRDVLKQPFKMSWFTPIKTQPKFHRIITNEEFISMMKKANNLKHKLILILLYSTGVRVSELINIRLSDIDFANRRIFINSLKNGKNRYASIRELSGRYLKAYIAEFKPEEFLFNGQKSLMYSVTSIFKMIKRVSNNKANPHLFRHTFATLTIEKEDVFYTQELLGQRSLRSTLHYNHISQDRLQNSFNPLDNI